MSYKSVIEIKNELTSSILEQVDNIVMYQVLRTGVVVDKDELIKALAYDREQYEQGYKDALSEAIPIEWIQRQIAICKQAGYEYRANLLTTLLEDWKEENE